MLRYSKTGGDFVTETVCNVDKLELVSEKRPLEPITIDGFRYLTASGTLDKNNNRLH